MRTLFIALFSIILSVAAQFCLKAGMSSATVKAALTQPFSHHTAIAVLTDKFIFSGFVLYGLGAMVWLAVLTKWDVSKAYPLVGLGFALTLAVGAVMGEHISQTRMAGVALICAGVFLVSRS